MKAVLDICSFFNVPLDVWCLAVKNCINLLNKAGDDSSIALEPLPTPAVYDEESMSGAQSQIEEGMAIS
jgi:hypothetical protein